MAQERTETSAPETDERSAPKQASGVVQLKQQLAGMDYSEQIQAIQPDMPLMFNGPTTGASAATASSAPVQMLAGNTAATPASSANVPRGTSATTVAGAAAELHPGERDASFNPIEKVEFEARLCELILSNRDAYMGTVTKVSRGVLAYIAAEQAAGLADSKADVLNLVVSDKGYFGRLFDETLALEAPKLAEELTATLSSGGGAVGQHLMAHAKFMWEIYEHNWDDEIKRKFLEKFAADGGGVCVPPRGPGSLQDKAEVEGPLTTSRGIFVGAERARIPPGPPPTGAMTTTSAPARTGSAGIRSSQGGDTPQPLDTSQMSDADRRSLEMEVFRGTESWTVDEIRQFSQQARLELNMPLSGGGPSGTTRDMLTVALAMGVSTDEEKMQYALAVMGGLGAAGAHSFHEIMTMAKAIGVQYNPGSYAGVYPASFAAQVTELKAQFANLFPDGSTLHPDAPRE